MFPSLNEGINCEIFLLLRCHFPVTAWRKSNCSANASLCLDSSQHAIIFSQPSINANILKFFPSNTNISYPKREYRVLQFLKHETKKTFLILQLKWFFSSPDRSGFLAILVSDTKMSKLIFCLTILFL